MLVVSPFSFAHVFHIVYLSHMCQWTASKSTLSMLLAAAVAHGSSDKGSTWPSTSLHFIQAARLLRIPRWQRSNRADLPGSAGHGQGAYVLRHSFARETT